MKGEMTVPKQPTKKPDVAEAKRLVKAAIRVEGERHRLWYLARIAESLGACLDDDEQDIIDEGAMPP